MCILFNIYIGMYKTAIVSLTKEIFMIKHSVILLLVMLVVASCTNKRTANEIVADLDDLAVIAHPDNSTSDGLVLLDLPSVNQEVSFLIDSLVDGIQMVQLDSSNDDAYVSSGAVTISDNYICISVEGGYKLFDKTGHFIANFGKRGQGPDEYPGWNYDAKIYEKGNSIYLLPMGAGTSYIMEYNLDGTFKSRIPLGYKVNKGRLFVDNDEFTIFSMRWDSESAPAIWKQNRKGEVTETVSTKVTTTAPDFSNEIYVGKNDMNGEYNVFTFNLNSVNDSLYHFNNGQITPKLSITTEDNIPPYILTELKNHYLIQFLVPGAIMSPKSILIMDKESLKGGYANLLIGSLGGLIFKGYITEFSSGYFVMNIEPGELIDLIKESIESNKTLNIYSQVELENLRDKIDRDGNNIIIYGKFR